MSPSGVPPIRLTAASMTAAGPLFLLYQAIRPYTDETTLDGSRAMASAAWLVSHLSAVAGFILFALGLLGTYVILERRSVLRATVITWIGVGLTLPYYGAEVFGLHVIGARAVADNDPSLIALVDEFRTGPVAATTFAAGLLFLAIGAITAAVSIHRSGLVQRWAATPLAVGFTLFLPQFFGSPTVRIAHGALMATGSIWLGLSLLSTRYTPAAVNVRLTASR
jgi:hypothetical protein